MANKIPEILGEWGLKTESLNKIRLPPGVIGKSTIVVVAAILVAGIAASRINNDYFLVGIAVAVLSLPVWFFKSAQKYATENPAVALLEGAELVTWRKQELSAKHVPNPPQEIVIPDPKTVATPQIE